MSKEINYNDIDIENTNEVKSKKNQKIKHKIGKYAVGLFLFLSSSGLIGGGAYNLFNSTNFKDYNSLYEFTSPSHQEDRCNTQNAFDAQENMYKYFHSNGKKGISTSEANAIGPVVGLNGKEVQNIIDHKLFYINYSCNIPTGSTQSATIGIVEGAIGGGILVGGGIAFAGLEFINRRNKKEQNK